MVDFTQDDRFLQISKFGSTQLLLTSFDGEEALSQPYRFTIEMISDETALDLTKMVGQPVKFSAKLPDDQLRHFHGKVLRAAAGGIDSVDKGEQLRRYTAEVVPHFWFLKYTANCRVFQEKTIPQIVEKVLKDRGLTDYSLKISGTHAKQDYCVQYNESDYHFVSRLLEEAGIYYYFTHTDKAHQFVMADAASKYVDCQESAVEFEDRFDLFAGHPVVRPRSIDETPPLRHVKSLQQFINNADAVSTIIAHDIFDRVIAGVGVMAFFNKIDVVAQLLKSTQVLKHPRHHATKRITHHVRTDDDTRHFTSLSCNHRSARSLR